MSGGFTPWPTFTHEESTSAAGAGIHAQFVLRIDRGVLSGEGLRSEKH